jgi:phenylacetate-CoA ligase
MRSARAPFGGPRNDSELDQLAAEWGTDTAVLKYDWSARRNGVFLWPLLPDKRKPFPQDFDPSSDVFMAFQGDDPQTYKVDSFAGVVLGGYILPTRDMRNNAWQIIDQRLHLQFDLPQSLNDMICKVSSKLLEHGAGYCSFDLMRTGDEFRIIEMNTCGVGTATWNDWPEKYAQTYTRGILTALDQIEKIPRYAALRSRAVKLGNDDQAPEIPLMSKQPSATNAPSQQAGQSPELTILRTMDHTAHISSVEMQSFAGMALEKLLRHASRHSPFYAQQLHQALNQDGSINLSAWKSIPLLNRNDLAHKRMDILARVLPAKQGSVSHVQTSGTEYAPTTISTSRLAFGVASTVRMRFFKWHGVDCPDRMALLGVRDPIKFASDGGWAPPWAGEPRGEQIDVDANLPPERQLKALQQLGPVWLRTTPSRLQQLALALADNPSMLPELLGIFTEDELLTEDQRRLSRQFLGHEPKDKYSLSEVWDTALQCAVTTNYHVQTEAVFTELLNGDGEPCRTGEVGRVVATSLYNFAMPIIRYDTGDYAVAEDNFGRFAGRHCACGKRLLRLSSILGRRRNLLGQTLRSGKHPQIDSLFLFEQTRATLWRLLQVGNNEFVLQLDTHRSLSATQRHACAEHVRSSLALDARVSVAETNLSAGYASARFEMFRNDLRV